MESAGASAGATSSSAAGASVSVDASASAGASASASASASAADDAAADAAVAGAARLLLVMTERFFEDVRVAASLRAALRRKVPVELAWERHYQHGGVERFEYFLSGREAVLDSAGAARVPALPATPAELLPLYADAVAVELERRSEKREPMLDALLMRLGAVRADALGGRLPIATFGGLKARGHPVGATGVYQAAEMHRQLTRRAGANQVAGARVALTQNIGGSGASVFTHAFVVE
jgi:hypothetical protein